MKMENGKWKMENDATRKSSRRRMFLFIALATFSIFSFQFSIAQHYVGLKAGYGAAHGRFYPQPDKSGLMWGKTTAGLVWKYFSPQQVVGGFSAELEFQQRAFNLLRGKGVITGDEDYDGTMRTVNSITMPIMWQPHLYMINRSVRFFVSAGVTFSYNTGLGDKLTTTVYKWDGQAKTHTPENTTVPYNMQTARDVRWAYGWLGGVGLSVLVRRWEIFAEGRYYYGMSDILRNSTKYLFHDPGLYPSQGKVLRSELDNIYISVGVTFRLGEGGILAPPLRKPRPAPAGDDSFTNIRTNR